MSVKSVYMSNTDVVNHNKPRCHSFAASDRVREVRFEIPITIKHEKKAIEYLKDLEKLGSIATLEKKVLTFYTNEVSKKVKSQKLRMFLIQLARLSIKNESFIDDYLAAKTKYSAMSVWEWIYIAANTIDGADSYYDAFGYYKFRFITWNVVKKTIIKLSSIENVFKIHIDKKLDLSTLKNMPISKQMKPESFDIFSIKRGVSVGNRMITCGQFILRKKSSTKLDILVYTSPSRTKTMLIKIDKKTCRNTLI